MSRSIRVEYEVSQRDLTTAARELLLGHPLALFAGMLWLGMALSAVFNALAGRFAVLPWAYAILVGAVPLVLPAVLARRRFAGLEPRERLVVWELDDTVVRLQAGLDDMSFSWASLKGWRQTKSAFFIVPMKGMPLSLMKRTMRSDTQVEVLGLLKTVRFYKGTQPKDPRRFFLMAAAGIWLLLCCMFASIYNLVAEAPPETGSVVEGETLSTGRASLMDEMIKLYVGSGPEMQYDEAWIDGDTVVEHIGRIGTRGRTRTHERDPSLSDEENIRRVLQPAVDGGYLALELDEHAILIVEFTVDGTGSPDDLAKRHGLEDRLNETLGWMGLGLCDGGSMGSGTMEVCCFVVDFEVAKQIVEADLNGTEFADYTRIFNERS